MYMLRRNVLFNELTGMQCLSLNTVCISLLKVVQEKYSLLFLPVYKLIQIAL